MRVSLHMQVKEKTGELINHTGSIYKVFEDGENSNSDFLIVLIQLL